VSKAVGFNPNYLWESFKRQKGSIDRYKKIADHIELNFFWLLEERGEPYPAKWAGPTTRPVQKPSPNLEEHMSKIIDAEDTLADARDCVNW
jgi:hypothetical protein